MVHLDGTNKEKDCESRTTHFTHVELRLHEINTVLENETLLRSLFLDQYFSSNFSNIEGKRKSGRLFLY